jgi:hypothetical protein
MKNREDSQSSEGPTPVRVTPDGDAILIGSDLSIAFQRTLRIPEDGHIYPLPPGFGRLPVVTVDSVPKNRQYSREPRTFIIPLYQREAMWLAFGGSWWRPHALQVFTGDVNTVDGSQRTTGLSASPQNYLVCPDQPWLDGIKVGEGQVRQFVALPVGHSRTIQAQLGSGMDQGGLTFRIYAPKHGVFPDHEPSRDVPRSHRSTVAMMGLGAGGRIAQRIYPDPYGYEVWDASTVTNIKVLLLNSLDFARLSGRVPPPSPVNPHLYAKHGLPWFRLYEEPAGDIPTSEPLKHVVPTGGADQAEESIEIKDEVVHNIERHRSHKTPK